MAGVRKFDHDEARRRYAAGESGTALAREYGVDPNAVYRLVNQRTAAREKVRQREYQTAVCEECRGPCSYNPYSRARRDRLLCRSCAGKADRTNVSLTDGGQLVEVRCCTCSRWLDPDDFSRGTRYRDLRDGGFHNACRRCLTVLRQDYRERHKIPCVNCGAPRLPSSENGGVRRGNKDTGLCLACYRATRKAAA